MQSRPGSIGRESGTLFGNARLAKLLREKGAARAISAGPALEPERRACCLPRSRRQARVQDGAAQCRRALVLLRRASLGAGLEHRRRNRCREPALPAFHSRSAQHLDPADPDRRWAHDHGTREDSEGMVAASGSCCGQRGRLSHLGPRRSREPEAARPLSHRRQRHAPQLLRRRTLRARDCAARGLRRPHLPDHRHRRSCAPGRDLALVAEGPMGRRAARPGCHSAPCCMAAPMS